MVYAAQVFSQVDPSVKPANQEMNVHFAVILSVYIEGHIRDIAVHVKLCSLLVLFPAYLLILVTFLSLYCHTHRYHHLLPGQQQQLHDPDFTQLVSGNPF